MKWELLIYCFFATACFAVLLRAPRRAIFFAALLGTLGFGIYAFCAAYWSHYGGYFLGTLCIAAGAEALARLLRYPATMFMVPAAIPLVPGLGLYNTMLALVQGQLPTAAAQGTQTMLSIALMAAAIALVTFLFRALSPQKKKKEE